MLDAAQRNLRFNLKRYFKDTGGGRGAIVEGNEAKLGAAALAGLAIMDSPGRPDYGPPHAASTGVYMEGFADAAALARALGDKAREAAYEQAL